MHQEKCIRVKFSEGLGIFDQHYGSPQIDEQEIYDGPTGKVIDIQGIQAHAGRNFFVPEGKEFSFDIDECPSLHIEIKAEPGTNTCLFLLVHERKHDWNQRFVVIGKTPQGDCQRHLMSNYFTIVDDNNWHEYVYDLRTIREEKDDNIYHQRLCPDAGSIREIQFYSWTGSGTHTFHFNKLKTNMINEALVKRIAQELLVSFKELPGFNNAIIADTHPIYDLDSKNISYYEVKFTSPGGNDNGYAIISATEDDLPAVEFSEMGKTHYERFRDKLPGQQFKMIRFGPAYITAESPQGKLLAEIGERPSLMPPELQIKSRGEGSDHRETTRKELKPYLDVSLIRRRAGTLDYKALKSTYKRRKMSRSDLRYHWEIAKSPHSPCTYKYFWADGYSSHTYFLQLSKNSPPNNNDHASGCGPTAWMNLYGWHDINWRASLLSGSQTTNNPYIENLTMDLHDYLGTFEPWWTLGADQGFTWPKDMKKGLKFAKSRFLHDSSYWYRYDWWNTDEPWVFEVARDSARKKRPFIVGYYEDWHYAIGYGIAECTKHGWKKHSWIKIYPAWRTNDSQNKWIPIGTIFGIYAAYDFSPLPPGAVGSEVKRYDWTEGWTTAELYQSGGNTYLFLLKQRGTGSDGKNVHIHRMNSNGSVGSRIANYKWTEGWTTAELYQSGGNTYLFLLKQRGTGSDGKNVHIHKMNANGSVGSRIANYKWTEGWTTAELYQSGGNTYLFLLKQEGTGSDGENVHIHKMNANGSVGSRIANYKWTEGWTQAQPFKVGNQLFLFLLKKGNGHVHIHQIIIG
jgi:hypothetical protein